MRVAFLKSRFSLLPETRSLVVSCGASQVVCGAFTADEGGRLVLRHFAREAIDAAPAAMERWSESITAALATIARREKMRGRCRLVLSGEHTLIKWARTPSVDSARRDSAVVFEAQQGIPCPLDQVIWNHGFVADDGLDLEMLLVAVKRDLIETVCQATREAGFRATHILPAGLTLRRAFLRNYPEARENALLIQIGARVTHLVFLDGERFFLRTLRLGGNSVTQALAEDLGIEFAAAEALKRAAFSHSGAGLVTARARTAAQAAAIRFARQLQAEIIRSTLHGRQQERVGQPLAIYLTGGGSLLPELATLLTDRLKLPVERFDPLRRVELSFAIDRAAAAAATPFLADLVGLALSDEEWSRLNLLPPSQVAEEAFQRRQPALLASAIMATAALLPVAAHYRHLAAETEEKTERMERRLQPLRALAARQADHLAQIAEGRAEIAMLMQRLEAKSSWMHFLSDLQLRLEEVEDVWLERLRWEPPIRETAATDSWAKERQLTISGCLLDRNHPGSNVSPDASVRVKNLQRLLGQSPFIAAVKNERFEPVQPGILRFDFTLVLNAKALL